MAAEDKNNNIGELTNSDPSSTKKKKNEAESLKRKKRASNRRKKMKNADSINIEEETFEGKSLPTVSSVQKKIDVEKARQAARKNKKPKLIITFDDVTKRYGTRTVVRNFSISLYKGELMTVLGPEGHGKSTIAKMASGLVKPTKGSVIIKDRKAGRDTNSVVSYQPDIPYFKYDYTVSDMLNFYGRFFKDFSYKRAYLLLKHFEISGKTKFENLTTTALFLVQVILVSSRKAHLYIFDDPLVHCDPKYRGEILKMINTCRKFGAVLLFSQTANNIDDITDKLVFLRNGRILKSFLSADAYEAEFGDKKISEIYKEVYTNA